MLYNITVKSAVKALDKPAGFVMDIVDKADVLTIRVYEDDILNLTLPQRIKAMEYLNSVEEVIKSYNIPCYIEGAKGAPPRRRV